MAASSECQVLYIFILLELHRFDASRQFLEMRDDFKAMLDRFESCVDVTLYPQWPDGDRGSCSVLPPITITSTGRDSSANVLLYLGSQKR